MYRDYGQEAEVTNNVPPGYVAAQIDAAPISGP